MGTFQKSGGSFQKSEVSELRLIPSFNLSRIFFRITLDELHDVLVAFVRREVVF